MSWDVYAVGTLVLPAERREAWKRARLADITLPDGFPSAVSGARTVEAVFARIRRDVDVRRMAHTKSRFTLHALLPEDAYLDLAGDLARAFAAASGFDAEGDLVVAGWVTAAPGLAFRLVVGRNTQLERLARAEEKRLAKDPRGQRIEAMVADHLRARELAHRAAQPPGAYCLGLEQLRDLVDRALAVLDRAGDAAVLEAVRKANSPFLRANAFATAAAVRAECRAPHPEFRKPAARTSALLLVVAFLDPAEGVAIARELIDRPPLDRPLWAAAVTILAPTPHAPHLLSRLRIDEVVPYGFFDREQWAGPLARAKTLSDDALVARFHDAMARARREPDQAYVAVAVASALLDRKVASIGPVVARARFGSGSASIQREFGKLLAAKPKLVAVGNAPRLASLAGLSLIQELTRRLKIEPKAVYDEIGKKLEAREHAMTHASLLVLGRDMQRKDTRKALDADARWVAWLVAIAKDIDDFYLQWLRDALRASDSPRAKVALEAIKHRKD